MGTTSSFFGGDDTQVVTPSTGFQTNYTFLANSVFNNPTGTSASSTGEVKMTAMSDTHFLVATRDSASSANNSFLQLFNLNSDGSIVQVGSNLNIGSIEPIAISANGLYGIMVAKMRDNSGGRIYKITWDGNTTLSLTQIASNSDGTQPTGNACITTVLADGRLMGLYSRFANNRFCEYSMIDTDGTTGTVSNKTTNFEQSSTDSLFGGCGTGDGIYVIGNVWNQSARLNGMKIFPKINSTTNPDQQEGYTQSSANDTFRYFTSVPTATGAVVTTYLTNGNTSSETFRKYAIQTGYFPSHFEQYSTAQPTSSGSNVVSGPAYLPDQNEQYGASIITPLKRTYNGSYQDGNHSVVAMDSTNNLFTSVKDPSFSLRRVVGAGSSVSSLNGPSTSCLMGTKIVRLLNDYSNFKFNFNVWNIG